MDHPQTHPPWRTQPPTPLAHAFGGGRISVLPHSAPRTGRSCFFPVIGPGPGFLQVPGAVLGQNGPKPAHFAIPRPWAPWAYGPLGLWSALGPLGPWPMAGQRVERNTVAETHPGYRGDICFRLGTPVPVALGPGRGPAALVAASLLDALEHPSRPRAPVTHHRRLGRFSLEITKNAETKDDE